MNGRRFALFTVMTVVLLVPVDVVGQTQTAGTDSGLRTPWGAPDLQGIWTNSTTTPMERPADLEEKEFLTEEEWAERNPGSGFSFAAPSAFMPTGAYNDFWLEKGNLSMRTSLIVDPPNGRYPPLTAAAQQRQQERIAAFTGGRLDSWEDFGTYERCITRGMPGAMSPGFYNHNYQILQTPGGCPVRC